jgi:glycerophosphoryl diester phosphodiesterase
VETSTSFFDPRGCDRSIWTFSASLRYLCIKRHVPIVSCFPRNKHVPLHRSLSQQSSTAGKSTSFVTLDSKDSERSESVPVRASAISARSSRSAMKGGDSATKDSSDTSVSSPSSRSLRHTLGLTTASDEQRARGQLKRKRPQVVGHRGALHQHLENTVPGFVQCALWNCDAVELDVFALSRDHENENDKDAIVMVFHGNDAHARGPGGLAGYILGEDENDDPITSSDRNICDLTFAETQQLQFNPHFAEFPCPTESILSARIPTLDQVLKALEPYPSMQVKIELKGPSNSVVAPVLAVVERLDMTSRCSYSSFDLNVLRQLRALRPDAIIGALFAAPTPSDYLEQAHACGASEIHLRYDECTWQRVSEIHAAGLGSMAWTRGPVGMAHDLYHDVGTTEGDECYQALVETGVQQICCNKPDILLRMLDLMNEANDC